MVEGARLESVYTGNRIEGSNPFLSAKLKEAVCLIRQPLFIRVLNRTTEKMFFRLQVMHLALDNRRHVG